MPERNDECSDFNLVNLENSRKDRDRKKTKDQKSWNKQQKHNSSQMDKAPWSILYKGDNEKSQRANIICLRDIRTHLPAELSFKIAQTIT